MTTLANIYSTPDSQNQLKQIAAETLRSSDINGIKGQSTFQIAPIENDNSGAIATNGSILNLDGTQSINLNWDASSLNSYKEDVDDGRYDATGLFLDPLQARDNEGDEILLRLKTANDLTEKGADPDAALAAASNFVASPQMQLSSYGLNYGTSDILHQFTNENPRVVVPADGSKREQFTKELLNKTTPDKFTESMNNGVNQVGASYSNPPVWTQNEAGQINMSSGITPDFDERTLDPNQNYSTVAGPGIVRTPNGLLLPDDADKRVNDFINTQLRQDLPVFSRNVGAKFENAEFQLIDGDNNVVQTSIERPVFFAK